MAGQQGWLRRRLGNTFDAADLARNTFVRVLQCDPRIAGQKVSGAFPCDDIDRALAALESGFAQRINRYTRYWVRVSDRRLG